jgi:hypothetical protein
MRAWQRPLNPGRCGYHCHSEAAAYWVLQNKLSQYGHAQNVLNSVDFAFGDVSLLGSSHPETESDQLVIPVNDLTLASKMA